MRRWPVYGVLALSIFGVLYGLFGTFYAVGLLFAGEWVWGVLNLLLAGLAFVLHTNNIRRIWALL